MGQPKVASATWRARNKRISRDSYEPVGQQGRQTMTSETHVGVRSYKNSKSRFEMNDKIPSQTKVESVGFFTYGTGVRANRKRLALSQDEVAFLLGTKSGAKVCR